jgi:toxin ParE1/3/4
VEFKIVWSPNAIKCVHAIGIDLVKRDSVINANKIVNAIVERVNKLVVFPEIGRMVPEFKQTEIKEVLVKKKRIIYEIKGSDINILAVAPERMALVNIDADWIWPDL